MEAIPVKIKVQTTIYQGNEQETFELTTFGNFYKKGESRYLRYEEVLEVGEIKTSVKFSDQEAVILRSGSVNMRLAFSKGRKMKGHYDTPYGTMDTLTHTKTLEHQEMGKNIGKLDLHYDFFMQEDLAGTYHMEISFKEENSANEHSGASPK